MYSQAITDRLDSSDVARLNKLTGHDLGLLTASTEYLTVLLEYIQIFNLNGMA